MLITCGLRVEKTEFLSISVLFRQRIFNIFNILECGKLFLNEDLFGQKTGKRQVFRNREAAFFEVLSAVFCQFVRLLYRNFCEKNEKALQDKEKTVFKAVLYGKMKAGHI